MSKCLNDQKWVASLRAKGIEKMYDDNENCSFVSKKEKRKKKKNV